MLQKILVGSDTLQRIAQLIYDEVHDSSSVYIHHPDQPRGVFSVNIMCSHNRKKTVKANMIFCKMF